MLTSISFDGSETIMNELENNGELESTERLLEEQANKLFQICDTAHRGFLVRTDLHHLNGLIPGVDSCKLQEFFEHVDTDGNNFIGQAQFVAGIKPMLINNHEPDGYIKSNLQAEQGHTGITKLKKADDGTMNEATGGVNFVEDHLRTIERRINEIEMRLNDAKVDLPDTERRQLQQQLEQLSVERAEIRCRLSELRKIHCQNAQIADSLNELIDDVNLVDNRRSVDDESDKLNKAKEVSKVDKDKESDNLNMEANDSIDMAHPLFQLEILIIAHFRPNHHPYRAQYDSSDETIEPSPYYRDETIEPSSYYRGPIPKGRLEHRGSTSEVMTKELNRTLMKSLNDQPMMFQQKQPERKRTRAAPPSSLALELAQAESTSNRKISARQQLPSHYLDNHRPEFIDRNNPDRIFKVVFVGDSAVGKTCFLHRFCHDRFKPLFNATIGVDFTVKTIRLDDRVVAVQLWDTAGQERFRSITKQYFRKADGVVLMYDVTNEQSFLNIRGWMDSVRAGVDQSCVMCLVGNKIDLTGGDGSRSLTHKPGVRLAAEYNMLFFETSAYTSAGIDECMRALAIHLQEREDQHLDEALQLEMCVQLKPRSSWCCV